MARHNKGILNEFSGKVDTVVGSSWNGIPYIRGLPSTLKKRKPSELQVARQARFALGVRLIQSMGELTAKCFKGVKGKTVKNEAMSRLLSQAVCGTYPDLRFDYSQVEIARGQLKKAEEVSAVTAGPGQISFSWRDNTCTGNAAADDRAVLVACRADTMDIMYSLDGGQRSAGTALLDTRFFSGKSEHVWFSFLNADGSMAADSVYVGLLVLG